MRTLQWKLAPLFAVFFLLFAACGEDVVDGGGEEVDCPDGYEYNPITQDCRLLGTGDGGTGDGGTGDGGTGDGGTGDGTCGEGAIVGQACTPDGSVLSQAQVTLTGVDCDGDEFTMEINADNDGMYELDSVPAGDHTMVISAGSFSATDVIRVHANDTTDLAADENKLCVGGGDVNIAVLQGLWDDVGTLLQSMEIDYEVRGNDGAGHPLTGPSDSQGLEDSQIFLSNLTAVMEYDIIFIECGLLFDRFGGNVMPQAINNLQAFVEAGKSLYVSDYAHPFVKDAFPDAVTFYNEGDGHGGARAGQESQTITAEVISPQMVTLLGSSTAELFFNLDHWTVAEAAGPNTQVHFQGTAALQAGGSVSDAPLMVSYDDPSGGTVIYTSFHNSAQDGMDGDMEEVLRFMIFQL